MGNVESWKRGNSMNHEWWNAEYGSCSEGEETLDRGSRGTLDHGIGGKLGHGNWGAMEHGRGGSAETAASRAAHKA